MDSSNDQTFTFINLSHPDDLKDQVMIDHIRCSAMTSFGKRRRKRERKGTKNEIVFEVRPIRHQRPKVRRSSKESPEAVDVLAASPLGGDTERILTTNEGYSAVLRDACLSITTGSELSFQLMLATTALYDHIRETGRVPTEHTAKSLRTYNGALQLLNEKIRSPKDENSDNLIGSMCGLLSYHYILGDVAGWNRHMNDLWNMLMLRGGIEALENDQLRIALHWTDICGAFLQDIPPHFAMSPTWLKTINASPHQIAFPSTQISTITALWKHELPDANGWICIFDSISSLLSNPNVPSNVWMEPFLHRILSLRPLPINAVPQRDAIIEEVCRIGTLLFLAPIWRTFGIHPVRTGVLRQKLLFILQNYFAPWGELRVVLVWVLMQAVREAETEIERGEFVMRVLMVTCKMDIQSWEALLNVIRSVLWIGGAGEKDWKIVREELRKFFPLEELGCENGMDFCADTIALVEQADFDPIDLFINIG